MEGQVLIVPVLLRVDLLNEDRTEDRSGEYRLECCCELDCKHNRGSSAGSGGGRHEVKVDTLEVCPPLHWVNSGCGPSFFQDTCMAGTQLT